MIPGELFATEGEIEINKNRRKLKIKVENMGDRPSEQIDNNRNNQLTQKKIIKKYFQTKK